MYGYRQNTKFSSVTDFSENISISTTHFSFFWIVRCFYSVEERT